MCCSASTSRRCRPTTRGPIGGPTTTMRSRGRRAMARGACSTRAFGHFDAVWDDSRIQHFVKQGILWALGDTTHDQDSDGMPDEWEARYGLDLHSATGDNGGDADNDGDGASNCRNSQPTRIRMACISAISRKARPATSSTRGSRSSTIGDRDRARAAAVPARERHGGDERRAAAAAFAPHGVRGRCAGHGAGVVLDGGGFRSSRGGRSHDDVGQRRRVRLARGDVGRRSRDRRGISPKAPRPAASICSIWFRIRARRPPPR